MSMLKNWLYSFYFFLCRLLLLRDIDKNTKGSIFEIIPPVIISLIPLNFEFPYNSITLLILSIFIQVILLLSSSGHSFSIFPCVWYPDLFFPMLFVPCLSQVSLHAPLACTESGCLFQFAFLFPFSFWVYSWISMPVSIQEISFLKFTP